MRAKETVGFSAFEQPDAAVAARLRISALADGELEPAEAHRVIDAVLAAPELEAYWNELHRAGDCLRSDEIAVVDEGAAFLHKFSARLGQEPAIVSPWRASAARSSSPFWRRAGLPGASIAAALLVVGWMVMPSNRTAGVDQTATQARKAPVLATTAAVTAAVVSPPKMEAVAVQPVDPRQLADYLAAHQQLASTAFRGPSLQAASFSTSRLDAAQP